MDERFDPRRRQFHAHLLASAAAPLLAACGAESPPAAAQVAMPGAGEPGEGIDWIAISPARTGAQPGKIEVLKFFSYGCVHCSNFNPLITAWEHGLSGDVSFQRVPVSFGRAAWSNLARLYYTLAILDELPRLDQAAFDAIHVDNTPLGSEAEITDWAVRNGIDAQRFTTAFDGGPVRERLTRAEQLARDYQVQSVPLITVDGRYAVIGKQARQLEDLLLIADTLIQRARAHPS